MASLFMFTVLKKLGFRTEYRHQSCQSLRPAAVQAAAAVPGVAAVVAAGARPAGGGPGCIAAAAGRHRSCHHPDCTGHRLAAGSAGDRRAAAWCR